VARILPRVIDTKYENILREERAIARDIASSVISMGDFSVWDIVFPVVLLFRFMRYKRTREVFILNLLFTKKLALEAARDMLDKGLSKEQVMGRIMDKTDELLASDTRGVYSKRIRQKQLKEIELLVDHYRRLLESEAKEYPSMLKEAYGSWKELEVFLKRLHNAEREVNQAAQHTLGSRSAMELGEAMERASYDVRMRKTEEAFFGPLQVR
jgi:hypothetical protein